MYAVLEDQRNVLVIPDRHRIEGCVCVEEGGGGGGAPGVRGSLRNVKGAIKQREKKGVGSRPSPPLSESFLPLRSALLCVQAYTLSAYVYRLFIIHVTGKDH